MNNKYFLSFGPVLLLLILVAVISSCQYNPCKARKVECLNLGMCSDGECVCINNWEGDSCQTAVNIKFDSYYAMVRTELKNNVIIDNSDDTLIVVADPIIRNDINFKSLRDLPSFPGWDAKVNSNMVVISEQTIGSATYYGEGSLNKDVLTITLFKEDLLNNLNTKTTYVGYKYETP